jgi:precorrin-6B C5,15-methyltransferase / cobalt-precorrin-6B C5,C15-methyltransferase
MSATKINIVGIGDDGLEGLTTSARQLVQQAELLIGSKDALAVAAAPKAEKLEIGTDLEAVVKKIEAAPNKKVVLLTPGDPMFYGTARYLCDRLGKDRFDVTPHVSSM